MISLEKIAVSAVLNRIRNQRRELSESVRNRVPLKGQSVPRVVPKVREAHWSDFELISDLKRRYEIVVDPLENWERLWCDNPALGRLKSRPAMGWVLEANDKIVGYLGNICLAYWYRSRPLMAAVGSGLVVEPSYRVFTIGLIEAFFEQTEVDLKLATTAIEPVAKIASCFGSDILPQAGADMVLFWVLKSHPFAQAMTRKMRLRKPMSGLGETLVSVALAADGMVRRRRPVGIPKSLQISEKRIDEMGEDFEALWLQKAREENGLLADRSLHSFRWHFDVPGFKGTVRIICCHMADELVGYAVVRTNPCENGLRRSILADILAKGNDLEVLRALLVGAYHQAERAGGHVFEVGCVPSEVQRLCADWKPYVRTLPASPFYYKANDAELHRELASSAAWYASAYDGDSTLMP